MKEFRAEFIEKIDRTKTVCSFRFKPQGSVDFVPGQFAQIIFDENDKANRNLNKYLSFSCRPNPDYIEFTKRISASDFSKSLLSLKKGDSILLKGPMGHCVLEGEDDKYAFLIGGIGITPVISILENVALKKLPTDVILLYSNASDEDIPFHKELDQWVQEAPHIKIVYAVSSCVSGDSRYCVGIINKDFVLKQISDYQERAFYIFGPPKMVDAMKSICQEIGCLPEKIKAENFIGY
jgi:ferredoxin-NADP reductase